MRVREGHTPELKARKRRAPSDWEDLEHLNKRRCHASNFRKLLQAKENRNCLAVFDDRKGDEDASLGKRICLSMSGEFGRSKATRSYPQSAKIYY